MGYSFASGAEASLFDYLKKLESVGEIRNIKCQDSIKLSAAKILYKPDFRCEKLINGEWVLIWCEMKGFATQGWRLKRRLWVSYGPGTLEIYKPGNRGPVLMETLIPKWEATEVKEC